MSTRIDREGAEHLRFSGAPRTTTPQSPAPGVAAEVDRLMNEIVSFAQACQKDPLAQCGVKYKQLEGMLETALQASAAAVEPDMYEVNDVGYLPEYLPLGVTKEQCAPLYYHPPLPAQVQAAEAREFTDKEIETLLLSTGAEMIDTSNIETTRKALRKLLASRTPAPGMAGGVAPEGYKLLKNTSYEERSFEAGEYQCVCCECLRTFTGQKRQVVCKACSAAPHPAPTPQAAEASAWVTAPCDGYYAVNLEEPAFYKAGERIRISTTPQAAESGLALDSGEFVPADKLNYGA